MKKGRRLASFFHIDRSFLFHHDLFDAHLCARSEAEEVDALFQTIDVDLAVALGVALSHRLTHAVVEHVAELGIASIDVQGVVDGVRIDAELGLVLVQTIHKLDEDACRSGEAAIHFGHHAVGVDHLDMHLVRVGVLCGLADFDAVAIDVVDDIIAERGVPMQDDVEAFHFASQVVDRLHDDRCAAARAVGGE